MMADGKIPIRDEFVDYIHPIPTFPEAQARARLERSLSMEEENIQNSIDPMQRVFYNNLRSSIAMQTRIVAMTPLPLVDKNVEKILECINTCVKNLRWKTDAPYDSEERQTFIQFISKVIRKIRPEDQSMDEKIISQWKKVMDHILGGGLPIYISEVWSELEVALDQHEAKKADSSIWDNMSKEVLALVHEFHQLVEFMLIATPDVKAPEIWEKMSSSLFPYVIKCLESSLIRVLITDTDHEQFKITQILIAVTYNLMHNLMQGLMDILLRQEIIKIFERFRQSETKNEWHLTIIPWILSVCCPIRELKADPAAGIILEDEEIKAEMNLLAQTMKTGTFSYKTIDFCSYEAMETMRRFLLNKANRYKIMEYGRSPETQFIGLALKGVESSDWRVQKQSLECLKIIAEDETLIERLRTTENCTEVLKGVRKSPDMQIRQQAVDVLLKILVKKPSEVKVTREKLERTNCGAWTEHDVRSRINDTGIVLDPEIDMTGCDGEWLIELLVMRRQNNKGYYSVIKKQFNIEPKDSIPFNKCLSKLEKLILSGNFEQEPPPYVSSLT